MIVEDERVLRANEACAEICGYGPAELLSLSSPLELFVPEERDALLGLLRADAGKTGRRACTVLRKDGRRMGVEIVVKPLQANGRARHLALLHRGAAEREEAQDALQRSEERFRTAFENASIGVALVGLDRRYLLPPAASALRQVDRASATLDDAQRLLADPLGALVGPR